MNSVRDCRRIQRTVWRGGAGRRNGFRRWSPGGHFKEYV